MAWVEVAPADPTAGPKPAQVLGMPILLIHSGGRWWAIEDRCSHANCSFSSDGEVDASTVICNCHGSEFDIRTGAVLRMPASAGIATFPVRVNDGSIEVDL